MNEIKTLLSLEMRSLFGINKAIHTKDLKAKNRYRLLTIVWAFLIVMAVFYVGALVYGLCEIGLHSIVPSYLTTISSALILIVGIFGTAGKIFGQKGYDILASMPIRPSSIVFSRFICAYITYLIFAFVVIIPGVVVYGICVNPNPLFYLFSIIGALFVPAIPLVISTLLGSFVFAISCRMKNKSLIQTIFMVLIVFGGILFSFTAGNSTTQTPPAQIAELANAIATLINKIYIPASWFNKAVAQNDILSLLLFIGVSIAVVAVTVLIVSKFFNAIVRAIFSFQTKNNYKISAMYSRGLLKSLYVREIKRYFSSSIYVTNTIIGPVMAVVISIALCVVGADKIISFLPLELNLLEILPLFVCAILCTMTTTSTAISMEGKQFWVIKSLPVPTKTLLDAKILLNLTLLLPAYAVCVITLCIAFTPSFIQIVWLIIIPLVFLLFSVVCGITINLKWHSFDWENETTVVKQSASSFFGGFVCFFACILFELIIFLIPYQFITLTKIILCALLFTLTAILYKKNNSVKLERL